MHIVVLNYRHRPWTRGSYLVNHLGREWEHGGHEVVHAAGIDGPLPAADLAIQHVDLTSVPPEYSEALKGYPRVLNEAVTDISKDTFSTAIISADDPYQGPVIVKTRTNYGGLIEWRLRQMEGQWQHPLRARLPWSQVRWLLKYPIYRLPAHVPHGVWQNDHLVVEKFLPERDADGHYRLRIWLFFGDREIHYMSVSNAPIVKSENTIRREHLSPDQVPAEIRAIRAQMGFDFGKFDYAMHNGEPVLYDVNKTPSVPANFGSDPAQLESVRLLSEGLDMYAETAN